MEHRSGHTWSAFIIMIESGHGSKKKERVGFFGFPFSCSFSYVHILRIPFFGLEADLALDVFLLFVFFFFS